MDQHAMNMEIINIPALWYIKWPEMDYNKTSIAPTFTNNIYILKLLNVQKLLHTNKYILPLIFIHVQH